MNSSALQNAPAISDSELRTLLLQHRRENWDGIQPPGIQEKIVNDILQNDCTSILRRVLPYFNFSLGTRILDIGSGTGGFVVGCRSRGFSAYGIEPDRIGQGGQLTGIQIATRRSRQQVFVAGVGENLPFPDASFDLVTLNQVIEHVADQASVLREAVRVLKPRGALYLACPNYLRFYEPHYKIFWLPLMPRRLGRFYLRLRGRNPVMLEQLTYTTNRRLRSLLEALGPEYETIDLPREEFLRTRKAKSFASRGSRMVSKATHLPLLGPLCLKFVLLFIRLRAGGCEMMVIRQTKSSEAAC